jgi:protein SCO1/2
VTAPVRGRLAALLLAAGLALTACGSDDGEQAAAAEGGDHASGDHTSGDHSDGPVATLEGPGDEYAGIDLRDPYQRPSFTLTDSSGAEYDFASVTAGRPTLLFFGYTNCPDVCPTTMADVALALRDVDPALAEQVQVVFVTTDPGSDTPPVLGEYLDRFDADLPTQFVGLTGPQDVIEQAQLSAGVPLAEDEGRLHSSLLLLYGADDQAHVAFDAGNTARDIAGDLEAVTAA